ncbi:DnaJ C terminal domain [Trypanosoma vivax]|uniref:Putative heat shock protein DNAJ n=1 Tax=Trypanosoma vivax (strain Y486) TaxID=1055687 RepID=G0TXZ6_TRYVY|nr:putative heat shock protein DNAJ [Trypanosoma vivax]KAH8618822.1 DnaJ C terminal domain [Trypanosoma vivax]CCC48841.1 putative heat shock protein DNAJ [Trypanosoma vivax Y486]
MFGFPDDMVNMLFEGMGGFTDSMLGRHARRPRATTHALPVTLRDLYVGRTIQIPRTQNIPCPGCDGRGVRSRRNNVCSACRGSGVRKIVRQMGLMMQETRVTCNCCDGHGSIIDPRDMCHVCNGQKTITSESPLQVEVEPGMENEEKIFFPGEEGGDSDDVVIVLKQVKDEMFERRGADLHYIHTLTLAEALCGFQFVLEHLDHRQLVVRRERGELTKHVDIKIVAGEGMPVHRRPGVFGDLIIEFRVAFPSTIEPPLVEVLRRTLPGPKSVDTCKYENAEECYVTRVEMDSLRSMLAAEAKESEREENPGFTCAAQ